MYNKSINGIFFQWRTYLEAYSKENYKSNSLALNHLLNREARGKINLEGSCAFQWVSTEILSNLNVLEICILFR